MIPLTSGPEQGKMSVETITPGRWRWAVVGLLTILTVINYADRGVLGVVGPILIKDFHLSPGQFGLVSSAFGWGYSAVLFASGAIVTALGPVRTYRWFVLLWSLLIGCTALVGNFAGLLVVRLFFGGAEGTVFPSSSRVIANWVTPRERARAVGLEGGVGIPLGGLIIVPLATWLAYSFGWQAPFVLLAIVGVVWVVIGTTLITDTPAENRFVSTREREFLKEHAAGLASQTSLSRTPWRRIFLSGTLWQAGLAFFASAYVLYFLLTFFPTYLVNYKHVPFKSLAILGTLPSIGMIVGAVASGFISDWIYRRTGSLRAARSYFAGTCLLATGVLVGISTLLTNVTAIVAVVSVAAAVNFMANPIFFAIPLDAAPEYAAQGAALTVGLGSLAGIAAPLLTGELVQASGTFTSAFFFVAGLPFVFGLLLLATCHPERL